jgi:hypothetical protein
MTVKYLRVGTFNVYKLGRAGIARYGNEPYSKAESEESRLDWGPTGPHGCRSSGVPGGLSPGSATRPRTSYFVRWRSLTVTARLRTIPFLILDIGSGFRPPCGSN